METINQSLFLWLNAPGHPDPLIRSLALFLAQDLIWAVPALIGMIWLYGGTHTRQILLVATASAALGLLTNQLIGLFWWHPRPFVIPCQVRSKCEPPSGGLRDRILSHCLAWFPQESCPFLLP